MTTFAIKSQDSFFFRSICRVISRGHLHSHSHCRCTPFFRSSARQSHTFSLPMNGVGCLRRGTYLLELFNEIIHATLETCVLFIVLFFCYISRRATQLRGNAIPQHITIAPGSSLFQRTSNGKHKDGGTADPSRPAPYCFSRGGRVW